MCPSCRKTLTNSIKTGFLKKCGHVICLACIDKCVKTDQACIVCGTDCSESDIVELQTGGTGFAGSGGAVVSSQLTPAFQG